MEWLKKLAPTLVAALGGPVAGLAVEMLGPVLGLEEPTVEKVQQALTKGQLTGDQIIAVKQIEADLKQKEMEIGFKFADLEFQKDKLFVDDTQDARHAHAANNAVFWLGVATVIAFAVLMGFLLAGCYYVLTKGIDIKDPGTVAVVFSLVGTIVGYLASNTQQVYNYFFGSSRGSQDKTSALADAVAKIGMLKK